MEKELLYRFFEGDTSLEEEKHIRQWLEISDENKCMLMTERKFYDTTMLVSRPTEPYIEKKNRTFSLLKELLKVAAVVLVVLTGSYAYYHFLSVDEAMAMQTISVPAGQRVSLSLSDGTRVWLNARTTLTYPVSFNHKERTLALDGEAYFEVAKDMTRPFVVHTSKGTVEALGTTFDVEAYASKDEFETTLIQGSVRVQADNSPIEEAVMLTPDKKTIWRDGKLLVEQVDDYTPYRWIEGLICFRNESFMNMMKAFEKYYGVNIRLKNQFVSNNSYTGKFRHTDGIDYALRVLQKDIRFKYVRDDENQIIYIEK
ncbi:anti-sigma factor [Bacteroidia bacterium]|nr:anti-sigma factor [Bacteroidia bacterium]